MGNLLFQNAICRGLGYIRWDLPKSKTANFDGVLFFCVFGIPLIPKQAAHFFQYRSTGFLEWEFQMLPIRWSRGLLLSAWARRAALVLVIWSMPLALLTALDIFLVRRDPSNSWLLLGMCIAVWILLPITWGSLWLLDGKNRKIRRILGDSITGSSDPMTFTRAWLEESSFATAQTHYNAENYIQATKKCLRIHNWWGAMFAARMVERFEDPERGREFVERILSDPEVEESLVEVEEDHTLWDELFGPGRYER